MCQLKDYISQLPLQQYLDGDEFWLFRNKGKFGERAT